MPCERNIFLKFYWTISFEYHKLYHEWCVLKIPLFYKTYCCCSLADVGYCWHCVNITCGMTNAFAGERLNNFVIRVGNDDEIENNVICYEQFDPIPPVPSGMTKIFNCSSCTFGSWVSISKIGQLLQFQEIRVYGGKYNSSLSIKHWLE